MATCRLINNKSQANVVSKSLTTIATLNNFHYKEPTDILNPVVIIDYNSGYLNCNYIFLSDFNRYYFVENITVEHQRIILTCKVDVLMSFASDIKSCQGIASRNSNKYNLYLNDGDFKTLQYNTVTTHKFPNSFSQTLSNVLIIGG